jgi:hypothetical protein
VATLSSSDTEEASELLSLSPAHGPHSPFSELLSSSGGDLFDDWPEANDMAMSVYVALAADALSSHTSMVGACVALKNPMLMTHLLGSPVHELVHLKNHGCGSLRLLVLRGGNIRRQMLTLSALLWSPFCAVVHLMPQILIGQNGKLCTLSFWRRASLILVNV